MRARYSRQCELNAVVNVSLMQTLMWARYKRLCGCDANVYVGAMHMSMRAPCERRDKLRLRNVCKANVNYERDSDSDLHVPPHERNADVEVI